jgi:hypothetical protein
MCSYFLSYLIWCVCPFFIHDLNYCCTKYLKYDKSLENPCLIFFKKFQHFYLTWKKSIVSVFGETRPVYRQNQSVNRYSDRFIIRIQKNHQIKIYTIFLVFVVFAKPVLHPKSIFQSLLAIHYGTGIQYVITILKLTWEIPSLVNRYRHNIAQ